MFSKISNIFHFRNGAPLTDVEEGFESGTEITFNCIKGVAGERTTWKIVCEDGQWVGRSLNCGMLHSYNEILTIINIFINFQQMERAFLIKMNLT